MKKYKMAELVGFNGEQEIVTDSLKVAQKFGKDHDKVMRDIQKLECSAHFSTANFGGSNYTVRGRIYPCYEITKDGFLFLAMGFTGKDAAAWREKFIALFNKLEKAYIRSIKNQKVSEWIEERSQGKTVRFEFTNEMQALLAYAIESNSESTYVKKPYLLYSLYTRMIYSCLFNIQKGLKSPRNFMNKQQLSDLARAEILARKPVPDLIASEMDYHNIYKKIKPRIKMYGEAIGRTDVPEYMNLLPA